MLDNLSNFLFFSVIILSVVSIIYPWRFKSRVSRVLLHLPLFVILLCSLYDSTIPPEMNIRIDVLVLIPFIGFSLLAYIIKILIIIVKKIRSRRE